MAPPTHLHLVRHAQGYHNLTPDNHKLHDPALTPLGKQQCADLQRAFFSPSQQQARITHVVASPIKRTLWTALLAFAPAIDAQQLRVIALPELQETSDLPCDTGSDRAELEREFEGQPVDWSRVGDGWNSKTGVWAPTPAAVAERARRARKFLRELAGEEGAEVVVVTHGGLLHTFTQDWTGFDKYCGTGWANTEYRTYTFVPDSGDEARIVETPESRADRGAAPFSEAENLRMQAKEKEWLAQSLEDGSQTEDPAPGPAIQEVGVEAVKAQA
ncbi:phosphoglycerate mutase family protein [Diplodia corticola]|uniref:Phosphoglycerate mutase family protein n=1 Tax=Diplodia corticola TaxID=236234 RepID=A0A1J9RS21_9PEZI|nr:phosphoglycerate mutase family protein [Diplodia corticola]OJD30325.1 phosphoglycerate mutase family protein [Diplodia corticola]